MPTYEYECSKCGYKFEQFQQITEDPLEICPKCKSRLERLIGPGGGFIFKGAGFYATDYRKPSPKEKKEPSAEASEAKSETKAEGKKKDSDSKEKS